MIELVGSNEVAWRPTGIDLETTSEGDVDEEATTPRAPTEDDDTEHYQTPVALTPANRKNKNKARVMAEPEDTPSGIEVVERFDIVGKERKALIRAADRVCTIIFRDWFHLSDASYIFPILHYCCLSDIFLILTLLFLAAISPRPGAANSARVARQVGNIFRTYDLLTIY